MDDLAQQLQNMLSTQEGQQNLKRVADMLGTNMGNGSDMSASSEQTQTPQENPLNNMNLSALTNLLSQNNNNGQGNQSGPDLSSLLSILGNQGNNNGNLDGSNESQDSASIAGGNLNGLDINMLMKMQKLLSATNTNDKNTSLIRAIKPHLKPERQTRADEAIRMMQLINVLPMLKESGLFGGGG